MPKNKFEENEYFKLLISNEIVKGLEKIRLTIVKRNKN